MSSRKRTLTSREAVKEEEADRTRARCRDIFEAKIRDTVNDIIE